MYTLTKEQHKFIGSALYNHCLDAEFELLHSLKPSSQEPVTHQFQSHDGEWKNFIDEKHLADTRADDRWAIRALYTNPAPMSKEDMVKVLELLNKWNSNGGVKPGYEFIDEAITIMQSAIEGMK